MSKQAFIWQELIRFLDIRINKPVELSGACWGAGGRGGWPRNPGIWLKKRPSHRPAPHPARPYLAPGRHHGIRQVDKGNEGCRYHGKELVVLLLILPVHAADAQGCTPPGLRRLSQPAPVAARPARPHTNTHRAPPRSGRGAWVACLRDSVVGTQQESGIGGTNCPPTTPPDMHAMH
jgi:hypothetical protein